MRFVPALVIAALGMAAAVALPARDALACGGCFPVDQTRATQVVSHRMVLSVSPAQSTLWDQVAYVGEPSEFAWVLPIHGQVDVGVSSDAFFATLENATSVIVHSPIVYCSVPSTSGGGSVGNCNSAAKATTGSGLGTPISEDEVVEVLQQSVVGPYEQVQLSSTDPMALRDWLTGHGYAVPAEVEPIIDAYVAEGFDFLAVRLVPGQGIDAMQPLRITTPGASLDLPLRMVAAGTGAFTPITLWVIGEGRYAVTGVPNVLVEGSELTWDFDAGRSNYAEHRLSKLEANEGKAWQIESALHMPPAVFQEIVTTTATDPEGSGYGPDAVIQAQADIDAAIGHVDPRNLFVTRLFANLPKSALAGDLSIGATASQTEVPRNLYVTEYVGDACSQFSKLPPQPDCYSGSGGYGGGGGDGYGSGSGCSGCAVGADAESPLTLAGLGLGGLALAAGAWRRSRRVRPRGASRSSRG